MARPKKTPDEQLTYRANFRATTLQGQQIEQAAAEAGKTVSDYLLGLAVGAKPRRKKATPERAAIITALTQLGPIRADINQLVKDRISHKFVNPEQVQRSLAALEDLAYKIHHLLEQ